MDIYCKPDHKVKFINDNGHDYERESAARVLNTDTIYEVEYVDIHGWVSYVKLKGIDSTFNTVMFIDA